MRISFLAWSLAPWLAALAGAAGCAAEKPPPPVQEAPVAATPLFVSLLHTSARPTRQGGALSYGDVSEVTRCPSNPTLFAVPAGGGLLLRFDAPVPTDLGMQLDTSLGAGHVAQPTDLDDEERLAQTGRAYFYENDALSRAAPTGSVAPREVALWPARGDERRFDVLLCDRSFAPMASGDELQSLPLRVSLVGRCPDFSVSLMREGVELRPGQARRVHLRVVPSGDGVGLMTLSFEVTGMPAGVTVTERDPQLSGADWSSPRETTFDVAVGPDAALGKSELVLHARLGALEHTAPLALTVIHKDDY